MAPTFVLLAMYIASLIGVVLGVSLTMILTAFLVKGEWSNLRFFTVLTLGETIGIYFLPLLVLYLFYPAHMITAIQEFPMTIHLLAISTIVTWLSVGYMRDRKASNTGKADSQSQT